MLADDRTEAADQRGNEGLTGHHSRAHDYVITPATRGATVLAYDLSQPTELRNRHTSTGGDGTARSVAELS